MLFRLDSGFGNQNAGIDVRPTTMMMYFAVSKITFLYAFIALVFI